jgi:hypothetical protein
MPADEPTLGELGRSINRLDGRLDAMAQLIGRLPTGELLDTRQAQVERDLAKLWAGIDALTKALETERDARIAAVEAERTTRENQIAAEKARVGIWFRWAFGLGAGGFGAAVAQILGWRPAGR